MANIQKKIPVFHNAIGTVFPRDCPYKGEIHLS